MLPEVFLVRAYQESERWEGGNEGFMCKAHQKNPRPTPTMSLTHFVPRAFHSHSPYFKQEVLHSILRGYFKNFLLGAAFSSLQSQDHFPAAVPAQPLLHVMVWRMNWNFSEQEKGIFQADVYSKVFPIAFC